jgi:hypothetical protein
MYIILDLMQNPELQISLQLIIVKTLPVHMLEHLKPEIAAPISHVQDMRYCMGGTCELHRRCM